MGTLIVLLNIRQAQSLPRWSCGFNLQLVQLLGRFSGLFLSCTAPGFSWSSAVVLSPPLPEYRPLGLLLRLPWRAWVCPREDQLWRGRSGLDRGDPGGPECAGTLWPNWSLLPASGPFLAAPSLWLCVFKALKRPPWLETFSVAQCVKHLKTSFLPGPSRFFSCHHRRERPQGWLHPPRGTPQDLSWLPVPPQVIPPQSPPSRLPGPLPTVKVDLALGLSSNPIPTAQHPAAAPFRVLASLSGVHRPAAGIVYVVLGPFSLSRSRMSCCALQEPPIALCPEQSPRRGIGPLLRSPQPHLLSRVQVWSCSVSSFTLPGFARICTFLSGARGRLPAFSWCPVRSSASEGVFLTHP